MLMHKLSAMRFFIVLFLSSSLSMLAQQPLIRIVSDMEPYESIYGMDSTKSLTDLPWDNPAICPRIFFNQWNSWVDTSCIEPFTLPFTFKIFDDPANKPINLALILVLNGGGLALSSDEYLLSMSPADLDAGDRGILDTAQFAESLILYNTIGESPNREFVMEWYEVSHFAECCTRPDVSLLHGQLSNLNYQIRLREFDNSFAFHYGPLDVKDTRIFSLGGWSRKIAPWILLAKGFPIDNLEERDSLHVLVGDPLAPSVLRKNIEQLTNFDNANIGMGLDTFPQLGRRFTFSFDESSQLKDAKSILSKVCTAYPSPAGNELYIKGVDINEGQSLQFFSATGGIILKRNYSSGIPIDVSKLESGVYVLQFLDSQGIAQNVRFLKE